MSEFDVCFVMFEMECSRTLDVAKETSCILYNAHGGNGLFRSLTPGRANVLIVPRKECLHNTSHAALTKSGFEANEATGRETLHCLQNFVNLVNRLFNRLQRASRHRGAWGRKLYSTLAGHFHGSTAGRNQRAFMSLL